MLSHHNNKLYMTTHIRDVEFRCTIVDPGSSLTIMPLSMLEVVGTLETRLSSSLLRCHVSSNASFAIGFINLDLTIGLCEKPTNFV